MATRPTNGELNDVVACVVALEERIAAMSGQITLLEEIIEAARPSAIVGGGLRSLRTVNPVPADPDARTGGWI